MSSGLNSHIASKSLLSVFSLSKDEEKVIADHFCNISFKDLPITKNVVENLGFYGFWGDEDVPDFLNLTWSYLAKILDEKSFNAFVNYLEELRCERIDKRLKIDNDKFSGLRILPVDISTPYRPLSLSETIEDHTTCGILKDAGIVRWRDIEGISEKSIILTEGFCWKTISTIGALVDLSTYQLLNGGIEAAFSKTNVFGDWSSLSNLLESWLLDTVKGKNASRDAELLMMRFGWASGKPSTLEDTASYFGEMTRERVRQIEKKWTEKIAEWDSGKKILPLWLNFADLVNSRGAFRLREFVRKLNLDYGWSCRFSEKALTNLMKMCPGDFNERYSIHEKTIVVSNSLNQCLKCKKVIGFFNTYFEEVPYSSIEEFSQALSYECNSKCSGNNKSEFFNFDFFVILFELNSSSLSEYRINRKDSTIATKTYYKALNGPLMATVELLLSRAKKPLHFTEVHKIYHEFRNDRPLSERLVHATLTRTPNVLLWGRGTFIRQKWAGFPYALIREIEENIFLKLKQGIPTISSYGPFIEFQEKCIMEGLPNEYALYSCLKKSADKRFSFPHFPYIVLTENSGEFTSLPNLLENFIKDFGGDVPYSKLKEFALENLQIKEFQLINNLSRTPNIFGSPSYGYIHTDHLNLDKEIISQIIQYTKNTLYKLKHVSIQKIFNDQIINCKLIGIDSPYIFSSLIVFFGESNFFINQNRSISLNDHINGENKSMHKEVLLYLKNQKRPCYSKELQEYFVDERGYSASSLNATFYSSDVLRYLPGCVLHKETIGWDERLERLFLDIVDNNYISQLNAGEYCGFVESLIENFDLPELDNGIFWTGTLISDLIDKTSKFKTLGYEKNPYTKINDKNSIKNIEELLYKILNEKFKGSCNYNEFVDHLSEKKIIGKSIPMNIVNSFQLLEVIHGEIRIK